MIDDLLNNISTDRLTDWSVEFSRKMSWTILKSSQKRRVSLLGIECSKGQTFHTKKTIICFKDFFFYNNYYIYFILGLHLRNMYLTTVISRQILVRYVYNYSKATLKLFIRTTVTLFITIASPLKRPPGGP